MFRAHPSLCLFIPLLSVIACDPKEEDEHHDEAEAFSLRFQATADGAPADCTTPVAGLGPAGQHTVGMSDLRFFVSNVQFWDENGAAVEATFDANDFQYTGAAGWVGLIDLTGNTDGSCVASAISFSEGTARTNDAITGSTIVHHVASVSFDVGVPQALMQEVIGSGSVEAAPSPLNELYWSWATGYRHLAFNMTVDDGTETGEGYLHIGSVDCAGDGELALESRDECGYVNTPSVELTDFDLETNVVTLDIPTLLAGLDFLSPIYDPETFEVIGEGVGVECHSSSMQPDCAPFFANVGLDLASGASAAADNLAFSVN
jgi:uncharacterized repeat protein (TIGR04052 family)